MFILQGVPPLGGVNSSKGGVEETNPRSQVSWGDFEWPTVGSTRDSRAFL